MFEVGAESLHRDLGYATASMVEKLLIDQIVVCHLRLYLWEFTYQSQAKAGLTLDQVQKWEKVVAQAQKRYLRALESLVRVRRLGFQIQVNVAAEGGQQINIGNLSSQPNA